MSQRQFVSIRERAQYTASVIASNTAGGSLGPFYRDKKSCKHPAIYTQSSDRALDQAVFFTFFLVFAAF